MWHNHTGWGDESQRLLITRLPDVAAKVVSEVGTIGQVEHLKKSCYYIALFDPEILADSRVKLEEGLTAQVVERRKCALTRPEAVSVFHGIADGQTIRRIHEGASRIAKLCKRASQVIRRGGEYVNVRSATA